MCFDFLQLVLDKNGAVIDEDEFLSSLKLFDTLMVLKDEEEWTSEEHLVSEQRKTATNAHVEPSTSQHVEGPLRSTNCLQIV